MWQRGDTKKPSINSVGEHHGANQEYVQNAEGNQGGERTAKGRDEQVNTAAHDEVRFPLYLYRSYFAVPAHTRHGMM